MLVTEGFAAEGLRKPHFTVLVALAEIGPASQAELGRRLWIDRKNMVAVIDDLEAAGLVERTPDEQDRRRNAVRLTRGGNARRSRASTPAPTPRRTRCSRRCPRTSAASWSGCWRWLSRRSA